MYKVKWRNKSKGFIIIEGISSYGTVEDAERQLELFKRIAPFNSYYIERL